MITMLSKNQILNSNYFLNFRCCKGFMYRKIRKYAIDGKIEKALRDDGKKELGRIFRRQFHMNAFQVRQGKGTSNSGEHIFSFFKEKVPKVNFLPEVISR